MKNQEIKIDIMASEVEVICNDARAREPTSRINERVPEASVVTLPEDLVAEERQRKEEAALPIAIIDYVPGKEQFLKSTRRVVSLTLTMLALASLAYALRFYWATWNKSRVKAGFACFGIFTVLYLIEAFLYQWLINSTVRMLTTNTLTSYRGEHQNSFFETLRNTAPKIKLVATSYHTEKTVQNMQGGRIISEKQVCTRTAEIPIHYDSWRDISGPAPCLNDIDPKYFGVLVHICYHIEFDSTKSEVAIQSQVDALTKQCRRFDSSVKIEKSISRGSIPTCVVLVDKNRLRSRFGLTGYILATLCFCSWPYQWWLQRGVLETQYIIRSEISIEKDEPRAIHKIESAEGLEGAGKLETI